MFSHIWSARLLSKKPIYGFRAGPKTAQTQQFIDPDGRKLHGGLKVDFSTMPGDFAGRGGDGGWASGPLPLANPWTRGKDVERVLASMTRSRRVSFHTETIPTDNKWLRLSERKRDRFGDPVAAVHYESCEFDQRAKAFVDDVFNRIAAGTDAAEASCAPRWATGHHHIGGCRMGHNESESVVDSAGQVHGVPNLFLAGASIFPSCASVNPTLTIVALALRTADRISAQLGPPR
jgi:choline dehydrogenase-like flavoprotein